MALDLSLKNFSGLFEIRVLQKARGGICALPGSSAPGH
jgi:hypothetical protein